MDELDQKKLQERNFNALDRQSYRNRLSATDEALRTARADSNKDLYTIEEIIDGSPLVESLRAELGAARDHIMMLNTKMSEERKALLAEAELAERRRAEHEQSFQEVLSIREKELKSRLNFAERKAEEREREVFSERKKFEVYQRNRTAEIEAARAETEKARGELEERLAQFEIEENKYRAESQKKLQENSKNFVSGMVSKLGRSASILSIISLIWSIVGGVVLIAASIMFGWVTYLSVVHTSLQMSWPLLTFYAIKGSILVGIAGFTSRYAFVMSSNYMKESLRTADRVHAIKFGQFYVETYGAAASWEQVKETFSNWNGEGKSAWETIPNSEIINMPDHKNLIDSIINKKE